MNPNDIQKRWDSFQPKTPDFRREGGVKLVITPSGYGVREDLEGRLYHLAEWDLVVGRDEKPAERLARQEVKIQSEALAITMEVPRDKLLGKGKTLQTKPSRKCDCQCALEDGRIVKPSSVFVTYRTPLGIRRYRILNES